MSPGIGKTDAIELSAYPSSGIQCVAGIGGDAPVGLVLAWEIALVDTENAYIPWVSAVGPSDLALKDKGLFFPPVGARFVRANISVLTSGKVAVYALGQSQAG